MLTVLYGRPTGPRAGERDGSGLRPYHLARDCCIDCDYRDAPQSVRIEGQTEKEGEALTGLMRESRVGRLDRMSSRRT